MSSNRILKRSKDKQVKKNAKQTLKNLERVISETEKRCKICSENFDPKSPESLDTWMVRSSQEGTYLFCPKCFETTL